jgi:hypothetical protein
MESGDGRNMADGVLVRYIGLALAIVSTMAIGTFYSMVLLLRRKLTRSRFQAQASSLLKRHGRAHRILAFDRLTASRA